MTATRTPRDEPLDGITLFDEPATTRLADDLVLVHHDGAAHAGITVLGDDLAIVHDDLVVHDGITFVGDVVADAEDSPPVLVDLTGRRPRVVRTLSFGAALLATGLLASIPAALLAPEQTSRTIDGATATSFTGRVFIDTDCNGLHSADESLVGTQAVQLVRNGSTVATTWTGADGTFTFAGLRADEHSVIRVVRRADARVGTPVEPVDAVSAGFSPDLPITLEAATAGGSLELALPATVGGCATVTPTP